MFIEVEITLLILPYSSNSAYAFTKSQMISSSFEGKTPITSLKTSFFVSNTLLEGILFKPISTENESISFHSDGSSEIPSNWFDVRPNNSLAFLFIILTLFLSVFIIIAATLFSIRF